MKLLATITMPDLGSALARLNQTRAPAAPALKTERATRRKRKIFKLANAGKKP